MLCPVDLFLVREKLLFEHVECNLSTNQSCDSDRLSLCITTLRLIFEG